MGDRVGVGTESAAASGVVQNDQPPMASWGTSRGFVGAGALIAGGGLDGGGGGAREGIECDGVDADCGTALLSAERAGGILFGAATGGALLGMQGGTVDPATGAVVSASALARLPAKTTLLVAGAEDAGGSASPSISSTSGMSSTATCSFPNVAFAAAINLASRKNFEACSTLPFFFLSFPAIKLLQRPAFGFGSFAEPCSPGRGARKPVRSTGLPVLKLSSCSRILM